MLSKRLTMATAGVNMPIPADLIIPFNDTSIPSGWTRYDSADDRRIIGAGSTYDPEDTGGAANLTLSGKTSDSQGAHTGATNISNSEQKDMGGAGPDYTGNKSIGSHSHDFSVSSSPLEPNYRQLVLIKANSARSNLPAKALPLWHLTGSDPSGLTQQYTADDDKMIRAGSTITTGGTESISSGVTTTSAGSHSHADSENWFSAGGPNVNLSKSAGAHTHDDVTLSFTFNPKEVLLGLWTNASAAFDLEANMIAMYESTTPPDGWYLCDGDNSTPDMRDYFLGAANQANQGTSQGDNTFSCTHSTYTWTHNHTHTQQTREYNVPLENAYHSNEARGNHAHTLSFTSSDYLPSYYSLAFIMYGG